MRLRAFFGFTSGVLLLGTLMYCSPSTTTGGDPDAGVCEPDAGGAYCPCDPNTYKPSDCYTGPVGTNGKGICKAGKRTCNAGVLSACVGEVLPKEETCNYADDDCNGVADDLPELAGADPIAYCNSPACDPTFRDAGIFCFSGDLGICGAGRKTCAPGAAQGMPTGCQSFIKAGVPEECNGVDDDCNGSVDDGLLGTMGACDVPGKKGECAKGESDCVNGVVGCAQQVYPATETCNGKDDNCDGIIDNVGSCSVAGEKCCRDINSSYAYCEDSSWWSYYDICN